MKSRTGSGSNRLSSVHSGQAQSIFGIVLQIQRDFSFPSTYSINDCASDEVKIAHVGIEILAIVQRMTERSSSALLCHNLHLPTRGVQIHTMDNG